MTAAASFRTPTLGSEDRYQLRATTAGCVGPPDHQMFLGGVTTAAAIAAMEDATRQPVARVDARAAPEAGTGRRLTRTARTTDPRPR